MLWLEEQAEMMEWEGNSAKKLDAADGRAVNCG